MRIFRRRSSNEIFMRYVESPASRKVLGAKGASFELAKLIDDNYEQLIGHESISHDISGVYTYIVCTFPKYNCVLHAHTYSNNSS